jgi:beta-lactamase superfamily II metal-dependent hydrolase
VVLSLRAAGRRVLLNGDVQERATRALLDGGVDLRADVADLPHHGSVVESSGEWLTAVSPTVVLQSSGRARLRRDKWAPLLAEYDDPDLRRLITERDGMVSVWIERDGRLGYETFLPRIEEGPIGRSEIPPARPGPASVR